MLHRSITFIHAALLALSAVLAFLVVKEVQEITPDDQTSLVWIRESDGRATTEKVVDSVQAFAQTHRVNVALELPDLDDPAGLRHLYLAVGDPTTPSGAWLEEGYPAFSPDYRTEVHPFTDLEHLDPRGFYYVFGPRQSAFSFLDDLSGLGLGGFVAEEGDVLGWFHVATGRTLLAALTIAALCAFVAVGSGVLLNARSYAVLRLQGMSLSRVLLRDLGQLLRFWVVAAALIAATTTALLFFYNGLAHFAQFSKVALFYVGVFTTVMLATHVAVLALLHRTDILAALKGHLPARLALVGSYAVRVPALALVLAFASSLVLSLTNLAEQHAGRELFAAAGQTSRIHFTGSVSELQDKEKSAEIGEWLRGLDAQGRVIHASSEHGSSLLPGRAEGTDFALFVVNDTYLQAQPVLAPDGQRYGPTEGENRVRLLIPDTLAEHQEDLARGADVWIHEYQGRDGPGLEVDIEVLPLASDQQLFTYGSYSYGPNGNAPFLRDPVVLTIPNGSDILHPASYYGRATSGGIVFPDPQDVHEAMEGSSLAVYINSVQPVAQQAADEYRRIVQQTRVEAFNLVAGTLVLFITGIAVCLIHARKNAQAVFARHISGWRFTAAHRGVLAVEVLLAVGFVGWAGYKTLGTLAHIRDPETAPMRYTTVEIALLEPLFAAGIAAVSLALVVVALAFFHRRIAREGASQA